MRRVSVWSGFIFGAMFLACGQEGSQGTPGAMGSAGPPGAQGPLGMTGPAGSSGAMGNPGSGGDGGHGDGGLKVGGGVIWKDATGAVVPVIMNFAIYGTAWTDEVGGLFADSAGILWSFNLNGVTVAVPVSSYNNYPAPQYWDGTGCTGTPYVGYAHARLPFNMSSASGITIRALKDNATVSMQFMQSTYGANGSPGCVSTIVHVLVAPMTDAPIVTPPATLPFTLPVHPEFIP